MENLQGAKVCSVYRTLTALSYLPDRIIVEVLSDSHYMSWNVVDGMAKFSRGNVSRYAKLWERRGVRDGSGRHGRHTLPSRGMFVFVNTRIALL